MNEHDPLFIIGHLPTRPDSWTALVQAVQIPTFCVMPAVSETDTCGSRITLICWQTPPVSAAEPGQDIETLRAMAQHLLAHLKQLECEAVVQPATVQRPRQQELSPQLRLRVLGKMEVCWEGTMVNVPRHGIELLTLLALAGAAGMTADALRERVYGDGDAGRAGLRKLLERLRRLMPEVVVRDGTQYRLNVQGDQLDADLLMVRDTPLACQDLDRLLQAAEYSCAMLLPGQEEAWVYGEREALARRGVDLWLALADRARERADAELAMRAYQAARGLAPLQERVVAAAMSLDLELGRPVQAVTTFLEYRDLLDETLGLTPPPLVEVLYRQALGA